MAIAFSSCNHQTSSNNETTESIRLPIKITINNPTTIDLNDSTTNALIAKGEWLVKQIKSAYKGELQKVVKSQGLVEAIGFCNNRAIDISDSVSIANQINIKRAALKNRNPVNAMTTTETKIYKDFETDWNNKTPIKGKIIANELKQAVYYSPIKLQKLCLNCHGSSEEINTEVAQRIKELYPEDKATDFTVSQARGMWVITFPEYVIK